MSHIFYRNIIIYLLSADNQNIKKQKVKKSEYCRLIGSVHIPAEIILYS